MKLPDDLLLLGPGMGGGGAENRFFNVSRHLFGGKCKIAVLNESDRDGEGGCWVLPRSGRFGFIKAVATLARLIRENGVKVIVSFGPYPNLYSFFGALLSQCRVQLIFTEITQPLSYFHYDCTLRNKILLLLLKSIYKKCDAFLVNNTDAGVELRDHFDVPESVIHWIPNLIDVAGIQERAAQSEVRQDEDRWRFISVGRLDRVKQYCILIQAFEIVIRRLEGAKLMIIGDGPMRLQLLAEIRMRGLENKVTLTGWMSNPYGFMRSASLYVCSSKIEGCPNSVLEAFALGVPVISTPCSSEVLKAHSTGACAMIAGESPEAFADQMIGRVMDTEFCRKSVRAGRLFVRQYDLSEATPKIESVLMTVIEEKERVS